VEPRFTTIVRERRGQVPFTEEQLTAMPGGLTAGEYRRLLIEKSLRMRGGLFFIPLVLSVVCLARLAITISAKMSGIKRSPKRLGGLHGASPVPYGGTCDGMETHHSRQVNHDDAHANRLVWVASEGAPLLLRERKAPGD
jgi:hypothetical protein